MGLSPVDWEGICSSTVYLPAMPAPRTCSEGVFVIAAMSQSHTYGLLIPRLWRS